MEFNITQIATGAAAFFMAIGSAVYGLKKNGKITFGQPKERRSCTQQCPDHSTLSSEVNETKLKLNNLDKKVDKIDNKVGAMAKDLNEAVGFIKAKTGGNL